MKNLRASQDYQRAIVHQAKAALSLMDCREHDEAINLGMVRRTEDWCWSTWSYANDMLTWFDAQIVGFWVRRLSKRVQAYRWSADPKAEDGWDKAMQYYNNHECS